MKGNFSKFLVRALKTLDALKGKFCSTFENRLCEFVAKNLAKCCSQTRLFSGPMANCMGTRATFEGIFTALVQNKSAKQILNVAIMTIAFIDYES